MRGARGFETNEIDPQNCAGCNRFSHNGLRSASGWPREPLHVDGNTPRTGGVPEPYSLRLRLPRRVQSPRRCLLLKRSRMGNKPQNAEQGQKAGRDAARQGHATVNTQGMSSQAAEAAIAAHKAAQNKK